MEQDLRGIAIIGMAARYAGANSAEQFWNNLRDGVESITFFSDEELLEAGVEPALLENPNYVKASAVIDGFDEFDPAFFGMSPREAEITDPQHRLFLESAWQALEHAGYNPEIYPGPIGVYAGMGISRYLINNIIPNRELVEAIGDYPFFIGNDKDFMPLRVAYKLNLKGGCMNIQSACSTSLVAIHTAAQSLLTGENDMVLAGGVTIEVPHKTGYVAERGLTSVDGHCRSFDDKATGTVFSSGVGIVLLKRLEDAVADGDTIYAVIKGSAINNDGSNKVSFTAPSVEGQVGVITEALAVADVTAETIDYVETHGTATAVGDLIEVTALTQAFRGDTDEVGFCAIGSMKTNIGHPDTAAGVGAVIKTALALKNKQLPPSLHFETPNAKIDFASSPFFVNTELRDWSTKEDKPRRAGVSSFGFGGTNSYAVLEEAPDVEGPSDSRDYQLLVLSARTESALETATENLKNHLAQHQDANFADAAYTLKVGRKSFAHRRLLVARDVQEAIEALEAHDPGRLLTAKHDLNKGARPVVFMFPGTGSQYLNMARDLYESEPTFQAHVDNGCELLKPHLGLDLRDVMYPQEGQESAYDLNETRLLQPALFVIEYALSQLLMEWGIQPESMVGHSLGEYVAACLAGVFSLEDALELVTKRAALVQSLPTGAMLAVYLPEKEVAPLLGDRLSIATVNGPAQCVVSGTPEEVEKLEQLLVPKGVTCIRVQTSSAFHSEMVDAILPEFTELVKGFDPQAPQIPFISNVTGTWITDEEATDPAYWARHLRQTVRFAEGVRELCQNPDRIFLEVGPGKTLSSFVNMSKPEELSTVTILQSIRRAKDVQSDVAFLLGAIGQLWMHGAEIDWEGFYAGERRFRIPLPTYPFERQRYWIEPVKHSDIVIKRSTLKDELPAEQAAWLYEQAWQAKDRSVKETLAASGAWLVFADQSDVAHEFTARVSSRQEQSVLVYAGESYEKIGEGAYRIDPQQSAHIQQVIDDAFGGDLQAIRGIVHLWSLDARIEEGNIAASLKRSHDVSVGHILELAKSLATADSSYKPRLWLVTRGAQLHPQHVSPVAAEQTPVWGLGQVIAAEHPELWSGLIDLDPSASATESAAEVWAELYHNDSEDRIVIRGGQRFIARLVRKSTARSVKPLTLRPDGSYLITGGLGNLGLELARFLVEQGASKLILMGRSKLPKRRDWDAVDADSRQGQIIRAIRGLEAMGASVHVASVDVTDEGQLSAFLDSYRAQWPEIYGVVHAAGTLAEDPILETDLDGLHQVLRPKALGGWLLHHYLKDAPLDFFVLFSSVASVLNLMRVGSYAAANGFLDGLARARQAEGLPALTINWGPWAEVGMAATEVFAQVSSAAGMASLPPQSALDVFGYLLPESGTIAVSNTNWHKFYGTFPLVSNQNLFAELLQEVGAGEGGQDGEKKAGKKNDSLAKMSAQEQESFLSAYMGEQVGMMLSIPADRLDAGEALDHLGLDSLMAIGLKNRIEADFGVIVPIKAFLGGASVTTLTKDVKELLSADAGAGDKALEVIPRRNPDEPIPLSFAQYRLWFTDQMVPNSPVYNLPVALRMTGTLDTAALQKSFYEIVKRHEALRTTFELQGEQPVQVITEDFTWDMPILDVRDADRAVYARVDELAREEAARPFNLQTGPLMRTTLLQLDEQEYVLLLNQHHIVSDGWSMGVFIQELMVIYQAILDGVSAPLEELPVQYADFSIWQRNWLQGEVLDEQLSYWKQQLGGRLPVLQLPTDRPRPAAQTYAGASHHFEIPAELEQALRDLSRQQGATLYMTLLAAFNVLLHRYTGQEDILVGSPMANRKRRELEQLIGFFVNTIVLRTQVEGEATFADLLQQVSQVTLDAFSHEDMPFEKLVEELNVERNMSYSPLFQVVFGLLNTPMPTLEYQGLKMTPMEIHSASSKFDMTLLMTESEQGLYGDLEYNTDLFDVSTIERMMGHYTQLLQAIVARPDQRIAELPIVTEAERHQLLDLWNDTMLDVPQDACLHHLFEQQAQQSPDATALVVGETRLTYRELNERANRLAHYLQRTEVGPDRMVGIYMERNEELIVAMLAVLKAGGAYVPLDPAYPKDRIAYTLEDAQVVAVLTQSHLAADVAEATAKIISVDLERETIAAQLQENPISETTSRHLSHVIYTSGSTGRPKGVAIEHRSGVTLVHWALDVYTRDELAGVLMSTSICFDLSVFELFVTLAAGGQVILAENALHLPLLPAKDEVTLINTVPSAINELLRLEAVPKSVRVVNLAGEPLRNTLAQKIYQVETVEKVYNLYGPSEDTTYSTFTQIEKGATTAVHIGRPLANTQVYLLDAEMQPVPVGVIGELYISGDGLARGYLNNPELTAEKFIANPFGQGSGRFERMYKTGDVARFLPDGNIDFLGRIDHQVKVRGFRIELGEIESVLRTHPSVGDVVVMAREDAEGDKRIVAYVVAQAGATLEESELRSTVQSKLPKYMVPSAFVILEAMPLTANGKVDRKALPVPQQAVQQTEYVAPRTELEEKLATIWADVLHVERVGIHDNFFDLGGHSLLATQVVSRIRLELSVELPLRNLFEALTIADLATAVEKAQETALKRQNEPALKKRSRDAFARKR